MMLVDTHAHLYGPEFSEDRQQVVERAKACGVEKVFLPNINGESVSEMLSLCNEWKGFFYPMLGLHPTDLTPDYHRVLDDMQKQLDVSHPYIAIGEVGLDYYWDRTYYCEQQEALRRQMEWASTYRLPMMIHCRSAHAELVELFSRYGGDRLQGVFHSFGGTQKEARELLEFKGFKLGINGTVTFKKSTLPEVLQSVPLERIVLETDAPYLTPVPYRGKRNESAHLIYICKKLAEIYGCDEQEVATRTTRNALELFIPAEKG